MTGASRRLFRNLPEDVKDVIRQCRWEDKARKRLDEIELGLGHNPFVAQVLPFVLEFYRDLKAIEEGFFASMKYNNDIESTFEWLIKTRRALHEKLHFHARRLAAILHSHPKFSFAEFV